MTELQTLAFGTHGETLSGRLFGEDEMTPDMNEEQKQRIRMHYKKTFLDYDPRLNMSELIQDGINRDGKQQP